MREHPTYKELEQSVRALEKKVHKGKRLEAALQESERRFSRLIQRIQAAVVVHRADTSIAMSNRSAQVLLRLTEDQMLGKTALDPAWKFLREDSTTMSYEEYPVNRVVSTQKPLRNFVAGIYRPSSEDTVWVLVNADPVFDDTDELSRVIVTFMDITQRKLADEALQESEELLSNILESMSDGILVLNPNFNYTYWNHKMERISKVPREELINNRKKAWEIFPHLAEQGVDEMMRKAMKGEVTKRENIPFRLHDGTTGFTSEIFLPLKNATGDIRGIVGVITDTTERKKLEAQLQQSQKMESIGTLAGGIAHDFNNLLMGIQGRTSLILNEMDSLHPYHDHLRGIEDYIRSATDLTQQLLGFASGGKYELKPTDLNELVIKGADLFGRTKKEISIHEKMDENLWTVEIDRSQIEQVLLNLYVNAWQSMPGGGELYLETENVLLEDGFVKPHDLEPGKYVKITVADTGVGMDEATMERVFDPFFTTKKIGRGTGLGLASAYGIIKSHRGIINVSSEKGKGTAFSIYLPASEKSVLNEREFSKDIIKGTETILLVDDEDIIIDVGKEFLKKLGYMVLVARNGSAAIALYETNKDAVDMVILDMIMPDMSGGDTYDRLKEINPGIKTLLASGYSINGEAAEIMKRGCSGFIQKPFNMKALSQKIREILDAD